MILQIFVLHQLFNGDQLRLADVLERQELSLNLLSKLVMSLILEKYHVVRAPSKLCAVRAHTAFRDCAHA